MQPPLAPEAAMPGIARAGALTKEAVAAMSVPGRVAAVPRTLVVLATAALILAGCASPKQERLPAQQVAPKDLVAVEGPAPVGRFYVKAGEKDLYSDLYEVTFSPLGFERLTKDSRVTTVGGCARKVVVAAAQREVGYADRLQELRGGKLAPVETLGLEIGSDPDVSEDCRILYTRLADAGPTPIQEIKLWDPAKGASSTVISGPTVVGAAWGPEGEIVVLKRSPVARGSSSCVRTAPSRRWILRCPTWGTRHGARAAG